MKEVELLSPAGDFEKLKIALLYGADAVYVGGRNYSLRANAKNFSLDDLKSACEFTHSLNKKIYVTVNIVFHDEDIIGLETYLKELDQIGIDAIITSDLVAIETAKKLKVKYEIHLSTQASVMNQYAASFYKELGVHRIVLGREASKEDIKTIKEKTNLDLECFIHGAMCTSFSGRCVLSNYCTNRDANRGGCAQVCRFTFETEENEFSMSSKDLNLIPYIQEMIEVGVNSFKVEGRMRGIYYIATVIGAYRKLIDKINNNTLTDGETNYYLDVLNRCANRDSTPQFFDKLPSVKEQYFLGRQELSNQDFLGIVLEYDETTKIAKIEQRNYFKIGDIVEFFGPKMDNFFMELHTIYNEFMNNIEIANHPRMIVYIKTDHKLEANDMMQIKVFDKESYL